MTEWQTLLLTQPAPLQLPKGRKRSTLAEYQAAMKTPCTVDAIYTRLGISYTGCLSTLMALVKRGVIRRVGKVERDGSVGRSKIVWEWVR